VGLRSLRCVAVAALALVAASPAEGQRVQLPSSLPMNTAPATAPASSGPRYGSYGAYGTSPGSPVVSVPPSGTTNAPSYGAAPNGYAASAPPAYGGGQAPIYGGVPALGYGTSPAPPGPTATFQGDIVPPPSWDPYATPGVNPPTLFPQDPTMPAYPGAPSNALTTMTRFLQDISMDYVWIPGTASKEFGVNDVDLSATFAIPFLCNPQTPLLVTPGFGFHFWNGPMSTNAALPESPDLPPRAYDAYLQGAWNPQIAPALEGELAFRIGVYTDFSKIINESLRYTGRGFGIVSLTPSFKLKAGVIYYDRVNIKLLPAGGIIWIPNDDVRFDIVFPEPRFAVRLPGYSTTEWWLYARGEYGGGSWTVKRANQTLHPTPEQADYNDMRVALGLEFTTVRELKGHLEVGLAFEREIVYRNSTTPTFRPDPMVLVGGGLAY
jgi:hypothetical protein